ncbi:MULTISPECIES: hypothetical protein [unclassified Amycolatopsis]|uniref:hypothetical protein n=1 Tax=unclassified Amycolatopsis TaxID=2618356 RepID=UPI001C69730F|nr:hypothetical protein [Amycolatopsis sp. DSM 110486]QYN20393.1 hypothetical protein K1T34_49170 [Amycolatopsis sp. DSM 110486]
MFPAEEAGPLPSREGGVSTDTGGGRVRVPAVPRAHRKHVALGVAVFAPGITSTSFVLSLGPALLTDVLGAALACLGSLVLAVHARRLPAIVVTAILAGAAQGLGQLGGLTMISTHAPAHRRAEANALLDFGGYTPAALLPVAAGYLSVAVGLTGGATTFAMVLAAVTLVAGVLVRHHTRERDSGLHFAGGGIKDPSESAQLPSRFSARCDGESGSAV